MRFWHAIRRFISVSWLVAAPLAIVVLIVALFLLLQLTEFLVGRVFGPDAAEAVVANVFVVMGMLIWAALVGIPVYGVVSYVRCRRHREERSE